MIYPTDGCVLILAPSGIMKGVKHPNAARLFMEYLMSVEASKIWVEHFGEPLRPEVSNSSGVKSAKEVKTIRPSVEEIFKGIPEAIKQWRETFGVGGGLPPATRAATAARLRTPRNRSSPSTCGRDGKEGARRMLRTRYPLAGSRAARATWRCFASRSFKNGGPPAPGPPPPRGGGT